MSTLSGSSLTASQSGLTWQTQPTPQTVEAGSSVSFTCAADYSKKIQLYEWEQNNLRLPNDDRYTVKNDGQTLEISQTKFEDRGDYRCVATRKGKVLGRSQNAELNIKGTCDITPFIAKFRAFFPCSRAFHFFVTFCDFSGLVFTCYCGGGMK